MCLEHGITIVYICVASRYPSICGMNVKNDGRSVLAASSDRTGTSAPSYEKKSYEITQNEIHRHSVIYLISSIAEAEKSAFCAQIILVGLARERG